MCVTFHGNQVRGKPEPIGLFEFISGLLLQITTTGNLTLPPNATQYTLINSSEQAGQYFISAAASDR